jgi:dTMP kinase
MFITLEGPDGSGKTTQMAPLAAYLTRLGWDVITTREPGGTPIGDQVRTVLFNLRNQAMQPRTEILLFQASRAQLVSEVIRPQLGRGGAVLCDRYADSTLAYQGYGHGIDLETLQFLCDFATGGLRPDLTLFLDVDAEVGLCRRAAGGDWNRLDAYEVAFHQRVRDGYLALAAADPGRWRIIDAARPPEVVTAALQAEIDGWLAARPSREGAR